MILRRAGDLEAATRAAVVRVCLDAHDEPDFEHLFDYLPEDRLHVLAYERDELVGHAVVTARWLQVGDGPMLRTGYVDAVSVAPRHQGRGVGSAVMRALAAAVVDYDVACLETERAGFFARLGWEEWRGPLAGRSEDGLIPTPDQTGIMILRLARTPALDRDAPLSIEAHATRIW